MTPNYWICFKVSEIFWEWCYYLSLCSIYLYRKRYGRHARLGYLKAEQRQHSKCWSSYALDFRLQKHQMQIYFRNPAETHGDVREIMSSKMRMERRIINRWRKTILLLPDVTLNSAKFLRTMNWKERHLNWSLVLREGNNANLWVSQKLQWQRICLTVQETQRYGFDSWVRKIPWNWKWQPTPVFLPGEFHGQRSLAGYNLWDCKELD